MTSKKDPRRKRLLIDPQFQAVFACYAAILTIIMVPVFFLGNIYFFRLFEQKVNSLNLPNGTEILEFAERQQKLMVVVFIGATILAVLINVIVSYIISNRIAGSMYRLRTSMNQADNFANAQRIEPRKADFFQEVTKAYNQLLDRSR